MIELETKLPAIRNELIKLAQSKVEKQILYQELSDLCGLKLKMSQDNDIAILSKALSDISESEVSENRGMLSVFVVKSDTRIPGKGFFDLAEKLKRFNPKQQDKYEFVRDEMKEIRKHWQDNT